MYITPHTHLLLLDRCHMVWLFVLLRHTRIGPLLGGSAISFDLRKPERKHFFHFLFSKYFSGKGFRVTTINWGLSFVTQELFP